MELYSTNATTLPEDPAELRTTNPDPDERSNSENATPNQTTPSEMLLRPDVFAEYICDGNTPLSDQLLFDRKYWKLKKADRITEKHLHLVLRTGAAFTSMINGLQQWEMAALNAGHVGAAAVEPWDTLLQSIQEVENFALASGSVLQKNLVQFPPESSHGQLTIAKEICAHLAQGRRFPRIFVKPNWKTAIPKWTVNGDKPTTLAAFQAITAALELDIARQQLKVRWSQLIGTHGGPEITKFGKFPEETCGQYVPRIRDLLSSWHVNVLPLIGQIEALGFAWNRFLDEQPVEPGMFTKLNRFVSTLRGPFNEEVTRFAAYVHLGLAQQRIKDLHNHLSTYSGQYARALTDAVERRDPEAYRIAFENLSQYAQRKPWIERRMHLLGRLAGPNSQGSVASAWAMAIWRRAGMHGAATIPGDALAAWDWLQLLQEREQRLQLDPNQILQQITALREESESITNELIDRRAWAGQLLRVTPEHKQALVGWLDTIKRIGAGTGKRTETLTRVARQQMKICREAVPVWIMPLHRVVQSFDFSRQIFDVVIFDESSQCDVIGLLALTLAKTSVIVGDDRQVTPAGGGIELSSVSKLIESQLHEIPNKELWDGHLSMYNLASQSFGGVICLLEHFRCVPQIIQFSNHLCYDGKIRPLRDPGTSPVSPAVVESRVPDGKCDGQTNEREARWIAALVYAASELPEYAGQSFGVIALLGTATTKSRQNPQAAKVHEILISKLGEPRCKELRLKCTTASAFQGDERDVMFLSIVDSSSATEGPLRLSNSSETQKRYNVAASRARNQMWVVHSLDTKSDLKPADLRQRLIQHARDPEAITRQLDKKLKKADSPFEKEVIRALVNAGYIVTPQWQVGAYSIDIVVEGNGQRLAVECDGERYHTSENLADDLARQSLLERLGWIFHRIRGSEFYRDRTKTLQRLFNRLTEMRIEPSASNDTESPSMPQESSAARVMRRAHELKVLWDDEEKQERQLQTLARPPKPSRIASSKARESAITTRALPSAVPESTIQPLTDSTLAAPATVSPPHVENPLILPESNATTPEDAEVNHKIQRALFPKPENKPRSLFDN